MIRIAVSDDIPWILETAIAAYPPFNVEEAGKWTVFNINNPKLIFVRGEVSFAVAMEQSIFWLPEKYCELQFLASRKARAGATELLNILKYINGLRKERGCGKMYLNSRLADLEPFAKRLGGRLIGKSYVLE